MERSAWPMTTLWPKCRGPHIPLRKIPLQIFKPRQWRLQMDSRLIIKWWTIIRAKLVCRLRINRRRRTWSHPRSRRAPSTLLIRLQRSSSRLLMSHHSLEQGEIHQRMPQRNPHLSINTGRDPCMRHKISATQTLAEVFLPLIKETRMLRDGGKRLHSIPTLSMDSPSWRE